MPVRTLSKELEEKAINELNEVPQQIQEHINDLRQWLIIRSHLKAEDQWLLSFLRGCKFNVEKAKNKLDFFYTFRSKNPELFNNRDPQLPEIQEILKRGILVPAQNTSDPAGPPLLMVRWEKVDHEKVSFINLIKVSFMSLEILINESDNFIIAGQHIVQDFKGFSLRYMTQMTPGICRKCILGLQNAYPTRIKGVHFVNVPSYFRILFNMVYPFLNKKLKKRVKVYGTNGFEDNNIYNDIPCTIFPEEYGGKSASADELAAEWRKKVESYRNWFLQDDNQRY